MNTAIPNFLRETDVAYAFSEPPLLEVSLSQQNVFCHGGKDGWEKADISGGTPPYSLSWSNQQTQTLISNLTVGDYTLNITDTMGCRVS